MNPPITCAIIWATPKLDKKLPDTMNLAQRIEKQLPAELVSFIKSAGELAAGKEESLYLVGGVVRDLLLGKTNLDLDLVVEGDAISLAQRLIPAKLGKITLHHRFNTAKLKWHKWSIDIATARRESYSKPGALPSVKPSTISDDLFRRDFTINAMAIALNPSDYGKLVDLYGGRHDLEQKLIRILHEKSLTDDATRIWRGLRYEQRLGFQLEADTLKLLKRDIPMLDTISGDRIRYELECILEEEHPERVFNRAEELGVLKSLHPSLKGDGWLAERFKQAQRLYSPDRPPTGLYLALLTYPLTDGETSQLISHLRLPKALAQTLRDTTNLRTKLRSLDDPELGPSSIYHILHGYYPQAITANLLASNSPMVKKHLKLFLDKLRYIKPALNGNDLIRMGVAPGPRIKEILQLLHEARLDGKVTDKKGEEGLVKGWLATDR